jgi:hypothetical protein
MISLFKVKLGWALLIFLVLDTLCVGMGMGVPIFCILFGFPVGWVVAALVTSRTRVMQDVLNRILLYALIASAFTFLVMVIIWGPVSTMLLDPSADLANFGIPMILYSPMASFIGWLALMMIVSPFLQLLMMLFGAYLGLLYWLRSLPGGA